MLISLIARVLEDCQAPMQSARETLGAEVMRELKRKVLLSVLRSQVA